MEPPRKRSRSASVSFAEVLTNPECLLEWVDDRSPTRFTRFSKGKALFRCRVCKHKSIIAVGNVAKKPWRKCGYCTHKMPPCSDTSCEHCQKDTVATAMESRGDVVWDESNDQSPNQVWRACGKKATWRCLTCDHTWLAAIVSVTRIGSGCPFCAGQKLCGVASCDLCFPRSVACVVEDLSARNIVWADDKDPKLVSKCSNKKVAWSCTTCRHTWSDTPSHITGGNRGCPFCAGKRLCASECESCFQRSVASSLADLKDRGVEWRDAKDPRSVAKGSNTKAAWSCNKCKHTWSAVGYSVVSGSGGPKCVNKTQAMVHTFVHGFVARLLPSIDVIHEWSPDWLGRRRFDIGIPRLRLIVEVDGKQHYVQVANWPPPHETQANDRWKKERATENGFSVFRIRTHDIRKKGSKWKEHVQELIHRHALELEDRSV